MNRMIDIMACAIALSVAIPLVFGPDGSSDLLALWLAGVEVAGGNPAGIYPAVADLFLIRPPENWEALAQAADHAGPVYPYIYPPIWAYLVAPLTDLMSFRTFAAFFGGANVMFMGLLSWLAWRACGRPMSALRFIVLGQIVLYGSLIGALAVFEDQPQIFVSLLIVLTIERSQAGAPVAAGAALALAAAIKLSPAMLIVPLLVLPGGLSAGAAFAAVGAGLGLASIGVAGWPLHAQFLDLIGTISHTAIGIGASFGLDRVLAESFAMNAAIPVEAMTTGTDRTIGWLVFPKSQVWALAGQAALLVALTVFTILIRKADVQRRAAALWPAGLIVLTLIAPVAWMHYFIAPLAFAPVLVARLGPRLGAIILIVALAPFSFAGLAVLSSLGVHPVQSPVWGFCAMLFLAVAFCLPRRSPLHAGTSSL